MPVELSPVLVTSDVSVEMQAPAFAPLVGPAFEERWGAWRARGYQHELAARRKFGFAAIAVAIVLALVVVGLRLSGAGQ